MRYGAATAAAAAAAGCGCASGWQQLCVQVLQGPSWLMLQLCALCLGSIRKMAVPSTQLEQVTYPETGCFAGVVLRNQRCVCAYASVARVCMNVCMLSPPNSIYHRPFDGCCALFVWCVWVRVGLAKGRQRVFGLTCNTTSVLTCDATPWGAWVMSWALRRAQPPCVVSASTPPPPPERRKLSGLLGCLDALDGPCIRLGTMCVCVRCVRCVVCVVWCVHGPAQGVQLLFRLCSESVCDMTACRGSAPPRARSQN
jgi:hypothetical protein